MTFIFSSDPRRFTPLLQELRMDSLKRNDSYLTNMTLAYDLLNQYEKQHRHRPGNHRPAIPSRQGTQQLLQAPPNTTFVAGTDGCINRYVQCWKSNCGAWGHIQTVCPLTSDSNGNTGTTMTQFSVSLAQHMPSTNKAGIKPSWLLLEVMIKGRTNLLCCLFPMTNKTSAINIVYLTCALFVLITSITN